MHPRIWHHSSKQLCCLIAACNPAMAGFMTGAQHTALQNQNLSHEQLLS